MISFELSAIDIILVIAVIILLILHLQKFSVPTLEGKSFLKHITTNMGIQRFSKPKEDYVECPRGFGNMKNIGEDNSVSERCLGCYKIMDCYSETE